ncbi:MAG TPA: glycogen/starch/alpha-glucan phosphorylase [Leptospiraceae bacterium]|nr:glycogen/starch/alpha-glucan phosphorylase [Leptospiraceae bacterium]HNL67458.1 glycogen/starch/alpha-glucan phosphorylase [Leptospiraceae bacterium]
MEPVSQSHWEDLGNSIKRHIVFVLGNDFQPPRKDTYYSGLAYCVRDRLIERWLSGQRLAYETHPKRVYYMSMEFLPGRFLKNFIINLGMEAESREALKESGFALEELEEQEPDPGLGNGGLGRLASCYLDSMACLNIAAHGYGIRYDYGIFHQKIVNGWQVEQCDNWLQFGNPWEITRRHFLYTVKLFGRSEPYHDERGNLRYRWVDTDTVDAMACDIPIPGYNNETVNNMRLWAAVSSRDFNLDFFNHGDYVRAMEEKVLSENISKVLYPSDEKEQGRELRLKQQYFFVAATFEDLIRRFKKDHKSFQALPDRVAVQLNDTHPTIGVAELMRILVDEEGIPWDEAWAISTKVFAYTNHTVLPEALETWPVGLLGRVLPRHLEIIFEINHRFLDWVRKERPGDEGLLSRVSIIEEGPVKKVRMANLAIVGSHSVNGVAALHSEILKKSLFRDFHELYPGKFKNITNGITQRRWLLQANPLLSDLITKTIGPDWIVDLYKLEKLLPHAEDKAFRTEWMKVKRANKERFSTYVYEQTGVRPDPDAMFDMQTKRIHEYKRQVLKVLHVITLYNRIREGKTIAPRAVFIGGKSAPAYYMAKLTIKLVNSVANVINHDPAMHGKLHLVFLPNYCVSQAEKVMPAADLSEQISTAGMEASGTGNMKFSLNGALTIGTLDGANIEIMEEVGPENFFVFGLKSEEVDHMRATGYRSRDYYERDPELKAALDMIGSGAFSPEQRDLFLPIVQGLLDRGDRFFVLADYRSYITAQESVGMLYRDLDAWGRKSVLNVAKMGKFSSDRSVREYAEKIWNIPTTR